MKKTVVFAAFLVFINGFTAAEASPMTLEDISSLKRVVTAKMNPAGDRIAYLLQVQREIYVDDDGPAYHELHVTDLEGNSTPFVIGDVDITDIAWSAGGESIYFLAKRDEDAEFNSLYEIALIGGEANLLFTHVNSIGRIYPSPDGARLVFTAMDAPPAMSSELADKGFKAVVYEESVQVSKVWMLDLEALEALAHD